VHFIDSVLGWDNASIAWAAVSALLHRRADLAIIVTAGLVNRAGSVSSFVVMHVSEDIECPSSVAAIVELFTGNQYLWRNVDVRPCSIPCNLYTVGDG